MNSINNMNLISSDLTKEQFKKISGLLYKLCGIHLVDGKQALVRARLIKRLRALNLKNFDEYLEYIESDQGYVELNYMVDVMTTNKTHFFREPAHFKYLSEVILPKMRKNKMRFWTAACSSGEEPFSLGIIIHEKVKNLPSMDIKILGTDISYQMLEKARKAVYGEEIVRDVPPLYLQKYFIKIPDNGAYLYQVKNNIRNLVKLAWLNLIMDPWPMKGPSDVIFCRNVMIYFDRPTQENLINRFWNFLVPGGFLFVGHSEGLSAVSHKFRYVRPAIYMK
jgi:chemotaxis protein methyltransferase CheR